MSTSRTLRTLTNLKQVGLIACDKDPLLQEVAEHYAIAVTPMMHSLIDRSNPEDPIAKQFIPSINELKILPQENPDPIGDQNYSPVTGIVHRYPDRILLKPLLHCPVYCRFCFRREVVGGEQALLSPSDMEQAFNYIESHSEIREVILTGGDPLMLPSKKIKDLIEKLSLIDHIDIIRIHSRVPVVDPKRFSEDMIQALQIETAILYLVIHTNHVQEFSEEMKKACRKLRKSGIVLLSQSVLLKGVNNSVEALENLMRACISNGIKPYYLHHGDLAPGTSHFRISIEEGQALIRALRGRVSGIAQPTYVLDIPGGFGKVPLTPNFISSDFQSVMDWQGESHLYQDIF